MKGNKVVKIALTLYIIFAITLIIWFRYREANDEKMKERKELIHKTEMYLDSLKNYY